jgi:hypothetical protein
MPSPEQGASSSMTNRVTYAPQDFQKMCKQAERDHETRKLVLLMERVKKQIAERDTRGQNSEPSAKTNLTEISRDAGLRLPSRSVPLER